MALVGGTDTIQDVPITFREAWDQPEEKKRELWREAIRKKFYDMIIRRVWRNQKKSNVPSDIRLIGTKWVFRIKND